MSVSKYVHHFGKTFLSRPIQVREYSNLSYMHRVGGRPLQHISLGAALASAANKWPQRPAVIAKQENTTLTYAQLLEHADRLAASLRGIGLSSGDRIGIWAPNCSQWVVAVMAAARAGLVSVAINPLYQNKEIEYCLKKVGVKALLAPEMYKNDNYYKILSEVIPEMTSSRGGELKCSKLADLKHIILLTDKKDLPGVLPYNTLMERASAADIGTIQTEANLVNPDSGCNIQFTSGTTGNPKAALLSHHGVVNNGYYIGCRNELNEGHKKICVQVPLFHVFGLIVTMSSAVQHGATLVLPSGRYSPTANIEALMSEKCDYVHGTPTMHIDLVNAIRTKGLSGFNVKTAVTGGSPVTPQLVQDLKNVLGLSSVKSVFGMTEGSAVSFQSMPGEEIQRSLHFVGCLHEHLEAKIVDENDNMVPFGTTGELWIRGYSVMMRYWGDKAKTEETIRPDGWLKSGDQMMMHSDGYGQIMGRLKDLVIRGGENIAPKEIEDVLSAHPDVIDCQVIGIHDDRLGEDVCAVVRLREGRQLDAQKLSRHCSDTLAKYKVPRLFKQVDEFPKTASGKVQKYILKNLVESGKL